MNLDRAAKKRVRQEAGAYHVWQPHRSPILGDGRSPKKSEKGLPSAGCILLWLLVDVYP